MIQTTRYESLQAKTNYKEDFTCFKNTYDNDTR